LVLPEPELVPVLPEPMLPEPVLSEPVLPLAPAPVLGVAASLPVVLLPVAPAPAPDLKCSSHSAREIWPSLFLSTSEKFGVWVLAPAAALPEALVSLEVLPEALVSPEVLPEAPVAALGVWVSALEPEAPDAPAA
jgi:hypothetical protein